MTPYELDKFLSSQRTCRVAAVSADGAPHASTLWFVWDGTSLWLYSITRSRRWADLRADPGLLDTTIEEVLRWTTPSPAKRRTVTTAAVLGGHAVAPGDKVLFWEASANRDERTFDRPMDFDIRRDPNPHLALGRGVHYCLGAHLARLEMRVVFEELLGRFAGIERAGEVEWTRSNRHSGIRHLPLRLAPCG